MAPVLFIATPTHGGRVYTAYMVSLIDMMKRLDQHGIKATFANVDAGHIPEQRDALVQLFLDQRKCTHILFVDSDMSFGPDLASRFLAIDKPFVAAICTRRTMDQRKLREEVEKTGQLDMAMARTLDFNVRVANPIEGKGDFCKANRIGMAFVLLERSCLETMAEKLDLRRYTNRYIGKPTRGFFDELYVKGQRVSEDFSFCRRWRDCGGEIWADTKADIKHIGDFAYGASYMQHLGIETGQGM